MRIGASSSTTKTMADEVAGLAGEEWFWCVAASRLHGKVMKKEVPWPGWLDTSMEPRLWRMMPWTTARPRPSPRPNSRDVKKGSNNRV